jgi:sterol desaturase/sphingolipid hydroxylase (fatty acid hydroxylase superfamily)
MLLLINFLDHHSETAELIIFASVLFLCWNIENLAALTLNYKKWKHAFINAHFIVTNLPNSLLFSILFAKTMQWTMHHHFGILYTFHPFLHPVISFVCSFLLLDFGEYIYHVLMHKNKRLWTFHIVHHSDRIVDISTTLREHPGENFVRLAFTWLWVFLTGTFFWVLVLRQIIQIFSTSIAHINYRLPQKLDRFLGFVFITPGLHQVHHHYQNPYTDSNYGDVLSIWDRIFGTLKRMPSEEVVFGIDTYMRDKEEENNFISIFKIPFKALKQEDKISPEKPISS